MDAALGCRPARRPAAARGRAGLPRRPRGVQPGADGAVRPAPPGRRARPMWRTAGRGVSAPGGSRRPDPPRGPARHDGNLRENEDALHAVLAAIDELERRDYGAARGDAGARRPAGGHDGGRPRWPRSRRRSWSRLALSWRLAVSLLQPIRGADRRRGGAGRRATSSAPCPSRRSRSSAGWPGRSTAWRPSFGPTATRWRPGCCGPSGRWRRRSIRRPIPCSWSARDGAQEVRNPAAEELAAAGFRRRISGSARPRACARCWRRAGTSCRRTTITW